MKNFKQRAKELVSKMTIEERASQLRHISPAIPRLNIPSYIWWNEALHGVARAGTATVFPQSIGLAASFDEKLLQKIGGIIAIEARAKHNQYVKENDRGIYKGLNFWSPNINIFRDPRWGRGQETYGEDPYLTSRMGVAFIKGVQGRGKYLKAAACAKHYFAHSGPEGIKHSFDAIVSLKDMYETYLPAFKAAVMEGKAETVMASYNRVNGDAVAGSKYFLDILLRKDFKFKGHVVSDCGAVYNLHQYHKVAKTAAEGTGKSLSSGLDLNCGWDFEQHLMTALKEKLVTEKQITRACERVYETRFKLGMFDKTDFDKIPFDANDTVANRKVSQKAAEESVVMLKNDGVLPLDKNKINSIAVIGPNADNKLSLVGNYNGIPNYASTILQGIQKAAGSKIKVNYSEGCHLFEPKKEDHDCNNSPHNLYSEAIACAKNSDITVLCVGLDERLEAESTTAEIKGDKDSLNLPASQQMLIDQIIALKRPTVIILTAGSPMTLHAGENANAYMTAWYPGGQGGDAVARIIFGQVSPSGKLPVSFYKSVADLPDFSSYSMKNRTYRYIETDPAYPFGYGLSYGGVKVKSAKRTGNTVEAVCINDGRDTEDVIQIYSKIEDKFAARNFSLAGFARVNLKKGEEKAIKIKLSDTFDKVCNSDGKWVAAKQVKLFAGTSQPDALSEKLTNKKCVEVT